MSSEPFRRADAALAAGRALAWALLIGGWLGLGSLGRQHLPLLAGGMLPTALWLLATGITLAVVQRHQWGAHGVSALLASGLLLAISGVALLPITAISSLALVACGWAVALVGASLTVRRLRQTTDRAPPPASAALIGAGMAWVAWAGPLPHSQTGLGTLWLGAAAAVLLAGPLRSPGPAVKACRSGLFDCAMPHGFADDRRDPQRWPAAVASLAMPPMMATLALLDDACSTQGLAPGSAAALHLLAMLMPAWLMVHWSNSRAVPSLMLSALLALGGAALFLWPGQAGWMAAGMLHGAAWSLAWVGRWRVPRQATEPVAKTRNPVLGAGLAGGLTALAVLCLGLLMAASGPAALAVIHLTLATAGALAGVATLQRHAAPIPQVPGTASSSIGRPVARL